MLDAYAARTCPVKTWNRFSESVSLPDPQLPAAGGAASAVSDEGLSESFAGGLSFTDQMLTELLGSCTGEVLDLRRLAEELPPAEQSTACAEAMARGVAVIVGGLLPLDRGGHRSGRPDLLVRGVDAAAGRAGYHPVKVRPRKVVEKRQSGRVLHQVAVSSVAEPWPARAIAVDSLAVRTDRDGPLLQIAHYWRLLEANGRAAAGPPLAGLIGTDEFLLGGAQAEPQHGITWVELDLPMVRTFSRSAESGWKRRTVLERYDHEHSFRVLVAENARSGQAPIVQPIHCHECESCAWWQVCAPAMGADDLSVRIDKTPLDVREIAVLRSLGIRTITDLAAIDVESLMEAYLPEVRHRTGAAGRLRTTARRARMMVDEVELERISTGAIEVPEAELEIDLDIENAADEKVYLWGFLVHDRRTDDPPHYVEFSAWHDLDDAEEGALAARAMAWLRAVSERETSVRVFHYSSYEVVRLGQIAQRCPDPMLEWGLENARGWCDLFAIVRDHWFGTRGIGLKTMATLGAGFRWRDEDPGGLNSQAWFEEACHGTDPTSRATARERVLQYNEDDVWATWHLRRWIREQS